jgi:predicted N-acetyltransferase YhbS
MDTLIIRRMEIGDAEAVGRIYDSIVQPPGINDFVHELKEQCNNISFVNLIAAGDDEAIGFLISYIFYGGFGINKSAWISLLCVNPRLMGRRVGQMLMEEAFKVYREMGIKEVHTTFGWDSVDLLSFFKNLGFGRSDFVNLRKIIG